MLMYIKKVKKMGKKNIFMFTVAFALLFTGCGEKKKENSATNNESPGKITVTNNVVKKDTTKEVSKENSGEIYYSYNQEGQTKEAKEIEKYIKQSSNPKTEVGAYKNVRKPLSPVSLIKLEQMKQKLSKNYILLCSACHSNYANGIIGPSLLDKSQKFIYQRITAFKTGKKKNVLMKELVSQLSDKQLQSLAGEIAKFNKEVQKMRMEK